MLLVSLISYIDRNTLALLAPTILKETHLSAEEYGFIISGFSIAYMLGNPFWGRILDRIGLRRGMTTSVSAWTVASLAHAFAGGFWSFGVARAALGFGEGATFPGGFRTVAQTLPPHQRGRGIAVAYSGGSLGAIVTPLIVTPIFLWWGWRAAFLFTGAIGFAWVAMWWIFSGSRPDLRTHSAPELAKSPGPALFDRRIWAFISAYALGALPLGFVLYYSALFLAHMGKNQEFIGKVLWIPPAGWEAGYFAWGWAMDKWPNRLRGLMSACLLFGLPLAVTPYISNVAAVLALMFLAMFATAGFVILAMGFATRAYSTSHAGLIAGIGAGSWSAGVAVIMPLFGRMFDHGEWRIAFAIAAAVPILGWLGWLLLESD